MEQQQNKDDNSGFANLTSTGQIVTTTTDTIDSVDIVKLESENDSSSSTSSSEDEVSEDKNCSTLTEVILLQSMVLGEDKNKECNDIIMNVEEKAGYSAQAQPTRCETDSDVRRKNVPCRAPRYFEPCDEAGQSNNEDKRRKKRKRGRPCYNCGDIGHRGPNCKYVNECLICSKKGHLIKDCRQINIEVDSSSRLCLKCGNEGHDMFTCNTEYISEDLKKIQCYVCKDFGHLCCAEYKTDEPTEVSCYKCGESGHIGSVCSVIEPIVEDPEMFCKRCRRKSIFRQPCNRCKKARKAAVAAALVEATTEKVATAELESAKGKKALKHSHKEKNLLRIPTVNNVHPIRHKAIWPTLPVPPVFGPYYGRPGSNIWLNPVLAPARNGQNKPQYAPLNWTHQPVTETSRQPLNCTHQPVTETSRQPLNWTHQPVTETSGQPLNWTHQPVTETSRQPLNWTHQPVTETSRQPLNWTHQPVTETSRQPLNWTHHPVTETSRQPLNWTHQPVTETSRQPLNWTHQPVTETSRQPLNWTYHPVIETSRQPLNWTNQPVIETSQPPLNWTCQPVTETFIDPAKPLYSSLHCPRQTNIQKETEFMSGMVLPRQSSSHQSTVPVPCRNGNNEAVNQDCTAGSPSLSATERSPAS